MENRYGRTIRASFVGYIVQAIINNKKLSHGVENTWEKTEKSSATNKLFFSES